MLRGEIPGRDGANDAQRLGNLHTQVVVGGRRYFAAVLVGEFRKEANTLGGVGHIPGPGLIDRPGGTKRFQRGEIVNIGFNQVCPAAHNPCPLPRRSVTSHRA
ncbi:hypothetical protein HORIV_63960 [Vreelandella olivaria]|uniref:Uncharacterized protein n=1 Tax=Vreelandella olivaria TaxID=390919 RepID=A0ABN5XAT3_9GAMM|nr:hypothetical protein HORIV_63960 [Halomonas olivaria]